MISLTSKNPDQEYVDIYTKIFGEWAIEGNCPASVYYGYDGHECLGFISGYAQATNTWYLQRAGFLRKGFHGNLNFYREALAIIHKEWPFIMSLIHNMDTPALKMNIYAGCVIIGTRMDTINRLWIEMLHKEVS